LVDPFGVHGEPDIRYRKVSLGGSHFFNFLTFEEEEEKDTGALMLAVSGGGGVRLAFMVEPDLGGVRLEFIAEPDVR
jgi:hypothetical protein